MTADDLRREDREARLAAQRELSLPLVLEAGAGTGKTTTLVARILSWCLGEGWAHSAERVRASAAQSAAGVRESAAQSAAPVRESAARSAAHNEAAAAGLPVDSSRAAEPEDDRVAAGVLSGVVAITFTEAAAAEMASRVARDLAALAHAAGDAEAPAWLDPESLPEPAERRRRARALLGTLDRLTVRTIHAFCLGLLTAHPLEAGRHPELAVDADGSLLEAIVREVVEERLRTAYGEPGDPHLLTLAGLGVGPPQLVLALMDLAAAGLPAAALAADPLSPARVAALARRTAERAAALDALLGGRLDGRGNLPNARAIAQGANALSRSASALALRMGGEPATGAIDLAGLRPAATDTAALREPATDLAALRDIAADALPPRLAGHLKKWAKGDLSRAEAARLEEVRPQLAAAADGLARLLAHLERLDPERLNAARRALGPLLDEVGRRARERGVETFQGLLDGAVDLLARRPEVRAAVRRGIEQLLVDEFQDTDRRQCELLRLLALDGPAAERPGLFLVGDPKQSIYGWRSADLAAYEGFVEAVEAAGGRRLRLVESLRSAPPILAEVEAAIEPVMRRRHHLQPPFVPLLPCAAKRDATGFVAEAGNGPDGQMSGVRDRRPVEHWISWRREAGPRTRPSEAAEIEAAALAADLRGLHAQGVAWREAAVLLRSMGDLDVYLEAFRRAGVPFRVGRDRQYYRRREVIEAAALVRAVLDPGDHLALLSALRSPAVGVPDAALVPLWRHGFPQRMTELARPRRRDLARLSELVAAAGREVPPDAPGLDRVRGWEAGLAAAVEAIADLRFAWASAAADRFVERLRRLFLPEPIAAARYLGAYRVANLDRFFRRLEAALDEPGADGAAVLRRLRQSVAEAPDEEEGRPGEAEEDAVAVLTIHGAKGLDFGHVYVVQTQRTPAPRRPDRTEVGPLPPPGRASSQTPGDVEYRLFGAPTLGFDEIEAERAALEAAERVRTLYVAMTRAKERLVVAGAGPARGAMPPEQARSHADLLLARHGRPEVGTLWEEAAAGGRWAIEAGDALWVFPDLDPGRPAEDEMAGAGPVAPPLPSPAEVERGAAAIAARRRAAAARMARPFAGTATGGGHGISEAVAGDEEPPAGLAELLAERRFGGDGTDPGGEAAGGRAAAMAAGSAIHRALELWDFLAPPERELARHAARLPAYLATLGAAADAAALARAGDLLARFAGGPFPARLAAIGAGSSTASGGIVARELPVLLPPEAGGDGPLGFVAGAIDLLYRRDGELVIADYKTDAVADRAEAARRAAAYAAQGAAYRRAVAQALGLPRPPRFELWFLAAGEVVEV